MCLIPEVEKDRMTSEEVMMSSACFLHTSHKVFQKREWPGVDPLQLHEGIPCASTGCSKQARTGLGPLVLGPGQGLLRKP